MDATLAVLGLVPFSPLVTALDAVQRAVKRNSDITITVNKEGYEPQIIPLTKEIPGTGTAGFAGNILAGGLVGMGVDAVTGAAQDHKPTL